MERKPKKEKGLLLASIGFTLAWLLLFGGKYEIARAAEVGGMKFWPFKKVAQETPRTGEFDPLVWEANTLAKVALVPLMKRFPQYGAVIESDLTDTWDYLMTIALTGVAANARGILSDAEARASLKNALDKELQGGSRAFDDYYEYTTLRTRESGASWSGVSAMWVAENFRGHSNTNADLKRNAEQLDFVNPIAAFMNISFGSTDVGFSQFMGVMALEAEEKMEIDMGLGRKGTKQDSRKKLQILAEIFELFAIKTVEMIAENKD